MAEMSCAAIVVALGGNALLRRGERPTVELQRRRARAAVQALAPVAARAPIIVTHGNGPQIALLAERQADEPLDVLGAESEGLIGYLLEIELRDALPDRQVATLLTLVEVDTGDPAFDAPSKPIGPLYSEADWRSIAAANGWRGARDGDGFRRVVPSPMPERILQAEVIRELVQQGVIPVCAGGGGIPVTRETGGALAGVEAVVDKDWTSARLAADCGADMLVMLTDVAAVYRDWPQTSEPLTNLSWDEADSLGLPPGSMGPKVAAGLWFAQVTGRRAKIGSLAEANAVVAGDAGTELVAAP